MIQSKKKPTIGMAAGFTAIALAGCSSNAPQDSDSAPSPPSHVQQVQASRAATPNPTDPDLLFNKLATYDFIDQEGKYVDGQTLKDRIKSDYFTLNTGFKDCPGLCVDVDKKLAIWPDMTHVIISTVGNDGETAVNRQAYAEMLQTGRRTKDGPQIHEPLRKVVLLFPITLQGKGTQDPQVLVDLQRYAPNEEAAQTIQLEVMGVGTQGRDPKGHSGEVILYNKYGQKQAQVDGSSETNEKAVKDAFLNIINTPLDAGRSK